MNSGCSHLRSDLALVHTRMIGLNVHFSIQAKMLEEGIQENTTTVVYLALSSARELANVGTCVNTLMGSLSVGCTLHNIELGFVKMV